MKNILNVVNCVVENIKAKMLVWTDLRLCLVQECSLTINYLTVQLRNELAFAILGVSLLLPFTVNANEKPNDILGVWLMANKNVKVEIFKSGDFYIGKVIWMDEGADKRNFKLGEVIIDDMLYNPINEKYEGGHFYGRGYKLSCELRLVENNRIEVKVSKGILYRIRYCTRVS